MHLARIKIVGHATEFTTLGIRYNGVARALFPCAPGGQKVYDVDWAMNGLTFPATWLVSVGTVAAPPSWILTFDDAGYGPTLDTFRGIYFEAAVAATGTPVVTNYDEITGPRGSSPLEALAMQTAAVAGSNARWTYPAVGALQQAVEASNQTYLNDPDPAPPLPTATSLTLTPTIAGAATSSGCVVYY
jgi:hypothetical protein